MAYLFAVLSLVILRFAMIPHRSFSVKRKSGNYGSRYGDFCTDDGYANQKEARYLCRFLGRLSRSRWGSALDTMWHDAGLVLCNDETGGIFDFVFDNFYLPLVCICGIVKLYK